jgi:flagellar hook-associated protein 2
MANVVSTAFSVGNGFSQTGDNNTDLLVQAYRRTRQPAVDALRTRQTSLERRQTFFNSLRSRLEGVLSSSDAFVSDNANSRFVTRKATTSDDKTVTVSTTSEAAVGVSSLRVNRLASNDILISNRTTLATANGQSAGNKNFNIKGRDYTVNLDGSETNEQVMNKLVTAVNADRDSKVTATLVKDTSTTGRLTFTSKSTGSENNITFTDTNGLLATFGFDSSLITTTTGVALTANGTAINSTRRVGVDVATGLKSFRINGKDYSINVSNDRETTDSLIGRIADTINNETDSTITAQKVVNGSTTSLKFTNKSTGGTLIIQDTNGLLSAVGQREQTLRDERTVATATRAGFRSSVEQRLDAQAVVNGIEITRGGNVLEDVLRGVSITLNRAQDSSEDNITLSTDVDDKKITDVIQPLLDNYNGILDFMKNEANNIGNDGAVRSLRQRIRGLSGQTFGNDSDVKFLTDVGLRIGTDGKLLIDNRERLKTLSKDSPEKLAQIFNGENGFAGKLRDIIDEVTGSEGLAQSRSSALSSQIQRVTTQRKTLETRIDREVDQQKREYKKLQETFLTLQGQLSQYSSFR